MPNQNENRDDNGNNCEKIVCCCIYCTLCLIPFCLTIAAGNDMTPAIDSYFWQLGYLFNDTNWNNNNQNEREPLMSRENVVINTAPINTPINVFNPTVNNNIQPADRDALWSSLHRQNNKPVTQNESEINPLNLPKAQPLSIEDEPYPSIVESNVESINSLYDYVPATPPNSPTSSSVITGAP